MERLSYTVQRGEDGGSLQDFLVAKLRLSRNRAKGLLDSRNVFVNGRRVWMARHTLRGGDTVEVLLFAPAQEETAWRPLQEGAGFLIVDKPAGLLSNGPDSAEEALRTRLNAPEITAVHRLDRDTSGCLLLVRTPAAFAAFVALFRAHGVHKTYHAIVAGLLETTGKTIVTPIDGQKAVTHVRTLDANAAASHLLVKTETGRTHQIRKHLAAARHPILGDLQYGVHAAEFPQAKVVPRQMLHASELHFIHPATGQSVRAKAPLPRDFTRCLRSLRLT